VIHTFFEYKIFFRNKHEKPPVSLFMDLIIDPGMEIYKMICRF
jgi:hypothetical protein